jgi:transaldolase
MKLFLDTADVVAIRRVAATGLLRGVTTNPSHIASNGSVFEEVLQEICDLGIEHVSAEAVADASHDLVAEAVRIAAIAPQIVVKIPMTREGLIAVSILRRRGIRTNVTMVFSPTQAFLAMSAGADFVSIVLSRLEKVGIESDRLIADAVLIKKTYGFASEIIAGSVKTQPTLLTCLRNGVDIATIPESLFDDLFEHPLTTEGLAQFALDWEKVLIATAQCTE